MRIGMLAVVVGLVASCAAQAAPIIVTFEGMTNAQVQAMFLGLGNNPVIASDHGGSVMAFSSGNISNAYRKYSPSGVDYLLDQGTVSADVKVNFDNTGTHGTAAFKGGLLLQAKTPGTEQYFARIVAKPSVGQIVLEVGNLKGTGHTAMGSVLLGTFSPGAVTGDIGWWNISANVSTVNVDQYQAVVTVTDPSSNATTYTWTDTGTARYTGAYAVGVAGHNQWSTHARYDNFTVNPIPEPATMALVALGGLFFVRRRHARAVRSR